MDIFIVVLIYSKGIPQVTASDNLFIRNVLGGKEGVKGVGHTTG